MAIRYGVLMLLGVASVLANEYNMNQVYHEPLIAQLVKEGKLPPSFVNKTSSRVEYATEKNTRMELQSKDLADLLRLRWLTLKHINSNSIPVRLKQFSLHNTNTKHLNLNGLNAESLTIDEDYLVEITGNMSRVQSLKIRTPELEVLNVSHMRFDLLIPPFGVQMPKLKTMRILHAIGQPTHGYLLFVEQLTSFSVIQSNLTTLPSDLLMNSPLLEYVDLSGNQIRTLPRLLLSAVPNLKTLLLNDNQLTPAALNIIAPVTWLSVLGLSGNPLGDLCDRGGVSPIERTIKLKELYLANIRATHLCMDWLIDMHYLGKLDYSRNRVIKIDCADLHISRNRNVENPIVDLTGNPLVWSNCTRQQYEAAISYNRIHDTKPPKMVVNSYILCTCGWWYMRRTLPLMHVDIQGPKDYEVCEEFVLRSIETKHRCP